MELIKITTDSKIHKMDVKNPPVTKVQSGQKLVFETRNAYNGQIVDENTSLDGIDWDTVCPGTGPVEVEGAMPGDAIKVYIEKIEATGDGILVEAPKTGLYEDEIEVSHIKILPVETGKPITFVNGIEIPWKPMVGVIGSAADKEPVLCGLQATHGGNMDCTKLEPGATIYLPVFHPGGMLAMGDVHAAMGDGEINATAVEIAANVYVTVELVKGMNLTDPLLEAKDGLYSLVSDESMEKASIRAAKNIRKILSDRLGLNAADARMLASIVGNLEVCQVVDPHCTMRFGVPHWVFESKK